MTEEKKTPESQKNTWDLLDVVTSRVGKITALIGAITGLVVGANQLIPKSDPVPKPPVVPVEKVEKEAPKSPALSDCFKPNMIVGPETVAISKWNSMMKLTGRNDCQTTLHVYVTLKILDDRAQIMADAKCIPNDPSCEWPVESIDSGDIHQKVFLPRLQLLSKPLGEPVKFPIKWIVRNVADQSILRGGHALITLQDDP